MNRIHFLENILTPYFSMRKKEILATDNTDKHEWNCSSSSLLEVFSDCTNLKKNDNRMIVIPVKKNDCHSRENGNLLFHSEK